MRLLERRGVLDGDEADRLADESPILARNLTHPKSNRQPHRQVSLRTIRQYAGGALAGVTAASVQGMIAAGERAGLPVRRVLSDPGHSVRTGDLCYASRGFSLHAATRIQGWDKEGLERLCRYVSRPPLAAGSLTQVSKDLLSFKLKSRWSDGTTAILLSPIELIEKLSALVPQPRQNIVRYHGVLAPHAKDRDKIVPAGKTGEQSSEEEETLPSKYRLTWSVLLARIFQIEMKCPHCGGEMKIVAAVTDLDSIRRYLKGTGQSTEIPTLVPARAPPQTELEY